MEIAGMKVKEAIEQSVELLETRRVESPRLSAELLVAYATSMDRAQVLANPSRELSSHEQIQLKSIMQRRAKHEPIPYITGEIEFFSIPFSISNGVFIPRPDTETLVSAALEVLKKIHDPKIYDMGFGCGNVIISLALNLESGVFWGNDISSQAYKVAGQNVTRHELNSYVTLREGNLFAPMRTELTKDFDMIVSNPPYVKTGDIQKLPNQIRDYEPVIALDGGRDGMNFIKALLDGAPPMLKPGGYLLMEADPTIMSTIRTEVRRRGLFEDFVVHNDASGKERVCQFRTKAR